MKKLNLVSKYTLKRLKKHKNPCNNDDIPNILNRDFNNRKPMEVVVSDLTYVSIKGKWNYICLLVELSSREIIGFSVSENKDAELVKKAFYSVKYSLNDIMILHTDRGSEFKNKVIDEIIDAFEIKRSLSRKGNPYDNAVCESIYNILKTEFIFGEKFETLEQLEILLFNYVNWYNNFRIHSSLGYLTPAKFKADLISSLS